MSEEYSKQRRQRAGEEQPKNPREEALAHLARGFWRWCLICESNPHLRSASPLCNFTIDDFPEEWIEYVPEEDARLDGRQLLQNFIWFEAPALVGQEKFQEIINDAKQKFPEMSEYFKEVEEQLKQQK